MDTSELDHDAILSQTLQQELDEFQKQNVSTLAKYSKQLEANGYCNNLVNRDCVLNWLVSETDCIFSKMGKIDRYFSKMNSEFEFNTFIFPTTDEYLNVLSMFDFYSFFYASKHNSNIVSHASSIVEKLLKQMEHAHRLQKNDYKSKLKIPINIHIKCLELIVDNIKSKSKRNMFSKVFESLLKYEIDPCSKFKHQTKNIWTIIKRIIDCTFEFKLKSKQPKKKNKYLKDYLFLLKSRLDCFDTNQDLPCLIIMQIQEYTDKIWNYILRKTEYFCDEYLEYSDDDKEDIDDDTPVKVSKLQVERFSYWMQEVEDIIQTLNRLNPNSVHASDYENFQTILFCITKNGGCSLNSFQCWKELIKLLLKHYLYIPSNQVNNYYFNQTLECIYNYNYQITQNTMQFSMNDLVEEEDDDLQEMQEIKVDKDDKNDNIDNNDNENDTVIDKNSFIFDYLCKLLFEIYSNTSFKMDQFTRNLLRHSSNNMRIWPSKPLNLKYLLYNWIKYTMIENETDVEHISQFDDKNIIVLNDHFLASFEYLNSSSDIEKKNNGLFKENDKPIRREWHNILTKSSTERNGCDSNIIFKVFAYFLTNVWDDIIVQFLYHYIISLENSLFYKFNIPNGIIKLMIEYYQSIIAKNENENETNINRLVCDTYGVEFFYFPKLFNWNANDIDQILSWFEKANSAYGSIVREKVKMNNHKQVVNAWKEYFHKKKRYQMMKMGDNRKGYKHLQDVQLVIKQSNRFYDPRKWRGSY